MSKKSFLMRNAWFRITILIIALFLILGPGCSKKQEANSENDKSAKTLTILTLNELKTSGFFKSILPAFERKYNCKVVLNTVSDSAELMQLIRNEKELRKVDLVLGLNNCFLLEEADYENFSPNSVLRNHSINKTYLMDGKNRVIPYGYGYLAIVYDEQLITQPPESFGELQDARFLNQLAICNPHNTGIGRATMFWTIALFGNDGFQQFWRSIKKNVQSSQDSFQAALNLVETQQCGMTIGFTGTPAWIQSNKPASLSIKSSSLKEGSFLYLEGAGIPAKAKNKQLAEDFLTHLLAPENQKFVAFNLGLFPANESTPLPDEFIAAPFTTYSVNDKLVDEAPAAGITGWLQIWDRIFSKTLY